MIICLGGICVPVHLLLAFFVAWAHRHGYLLFLREEWFTFRYWRGKLRGKLVKTSENTIKEVNKVE